MSLETFRLQRDAELSQRELAHDALVFPERQIFDYLLNGQLEKSTIAIIEQMRSTNPIFEDRVLAYIDVIAEYNIASYSEYETIMRNELDDFMQIFSIKKNGGKSTAKILTKRTDKNFV